MRYLATAFCGLVLLAPSTLAGSSLSTVSRAVERDDAAAVLGTWEMETDFQGRSIPAVMTIARDADGTLTGTWSSMGREMAMSRIAFKDGVLSFERRMGDGPVLEFTGRVKDDAIEGSWRSEMGNFDCGGRRKGTGESPASQPDEAPVPDLHDRPIVEENGRTLLWAREGEDGEVEWFDMTASLIDPRRFQFGIGKDTIPSVDAPVFVSFDDPRVAEAGITRETPVLGIVIDGVARAYPVDLMSMHEVVNDVIAGEPYLVMW
jgi:hypothetical protein